MAVHRVGSGSDDAEPGEFEEEEGRGENWGKIGFEAEQKANREDDGEEEEKEEEEEEEEYVVRKEGFPVDYSGL